MKNDARRTDAAKAWNTRTPPPSVELAADSDCQHTPMIILQKNSHRLWACAECGSYLGDAMAILKMETDVTDDDLAKKRQALSGVDYSGEKELRVIAGIG